MLRPKNFGFNFGTKSTNPLQNEVNFDQKYIAHKAMAEFDEMLTILDSHQIAVHAFEDQEHSYLPDAVFINNWLTITPERDLYLFPMACESRRRERRDDIVRELKSRLSINKIVDLSHHELKGEFLESTGSIVLDYQNKIAFASISSRTNEALFETFCKSIDYESFVFSGKDLSSKPIYHTNILLSIANDYAIVCEDAIENTIERAMLKKRIEKLGKEIIYISFHQMLSFAGNCLEVFDKEGKSKLVISRTGFASLKETQIQAIEKYSEIVPVNVSIIERVGGGSARCMMLGVPCS